MNEYQLTIVLYSVTFLLYSGLGLALPEYDEQWQG